MAEGQLKHVLQPDEIKCASLEFRHLICSNFPGKGNQEVVRELASPHPGSLPAVREQGRL